MANLNMVQLIGNLTRDVELRQTESGTAVCTLGVAVNEKRKDGTEDVVFVDVTLWERQAEVAAEYLGKGSPVYIEGRLKLDKWQTKEGEARQMLTVTGRRMQMLGSKQQQQQQTAVEELQQPAEAWPQTDNPF